MGQEPRNARYKTVFLSSIVLLILAVTIGATAPLWYTPNGTGSRLMLILACLIIGAVFSGFFFLYRLRRQNDASDSQPPT